MFDTSRYAAIAASGTRLARQGHAMGMLLTPRDGRKPGTARIAVVSLLLLLLLFSVALRPAAGQDAARKVVRSGCEVDYPPFCIVQADGASTGFSVELMQAALGAMGREVSFRTGPWAEVKGWLERGEIDALPLVGRTPEREELFDFTVPYLTMHGAIVVRRDTTGIRSLEDLRGRRVGVMAGDNAEEFLRREERGLEIATSPTFAEAFQALAAGHLEAVVVQRLVALRLLAESSLRDDLRIVDQPLAEFSQDFCFAVRDGDRGTLALLNEGLALVVADGTQRRLHAKWFARLELPSDRPIVVGGDHNFPPFEFLDEKGRPSGFAVELTRAIAHEMGMDVQIRLGPWERTVDALEKGEIDAVEGMFYSPERDRVLAFSPRYLAIHCVGVVRRGSGEPPATLDELAGRDLVVQAGDAVLEVLEEQGIRARITTVDTQEEVVREVAEGRRECGLLTRVGALHAMEKNGWANLEIGRSLYSGQYCYAVRQGQDALLAQFADGLRALKDSGEYQRLYDKWLGTYETGPRWHEVAKYVAYVAVPLLMVVVLALVWSWSLRRLVVRRTAELARVAREWQATFDAARDAIWLLDRDHRILRANRTTERIFGRTADECVGKLCWEIVRGTPEPCPDCPALRARRSLRRESLELPMGDQWIEVTVDPVLDAAGEYAGAVHAVRDITAHRRQDETVHRLNRVLRAIRDVNQLIVRETSPERLILAACDLLVEDRSYTAALIVLTDEQGRATRYAQTGMDAIFPPLAAWIEEGRVPPCCAAAANGEGIHIVSAGEPACGPCPLAARCPGVGVICARMVHDSDMLGFLAVSGSAELGVDEEERNLFLEVAGDLGYALHTIAAHAAREAAEAARDAAREQLLQAQKMESVGRLAGGVAHDFNNKLMTILANAQLCQLDLAPEHPVCEYVDEIVETAHRSADLTRQLLAFARKQTVQPTVLDLNGAVPGMMKLLQRLIGENIRLVWKPGASLWPVFMDPSQLDQILANLAVNARDAIGGPGTVTVETANLAVDKAYAARHPEAEPGDYVTLTVSDDGCGMGEEVLGHLFEPFFTTKELGRGTGLGLATVYGIVRQNRGFISVDSEPGKGSTFKVHVPRCLAESGNLDSGMEEEVPAARGETVLLVEDEEPLLRSTSHMLSRLGYRVLAVSSAARALELAAAHPNPVDLLLTDVVMPETNGRELRERLAALQPSLRSVFMSGYTAEIIAHEGVLEKGVHFLQKPFTRLQLGRKLREVLDRPAG